MTKDFNFIKNILIALFMCLAVACTTVNDGKDNDDSGNKDNDSKNENVSHGGKKYGSRMEALTALFDNTTLGVITLTISEDQWEQMISNTNNKKKDSYVKTDFEYKKDGAVYKMSEIGIRNRGNSTYRPPEDNGGIATSSFQIKIS